jgi:membrane protein DedA with SNARE-associated domain/uncharacterized tellurite resistance protein B-like protein
MPPIVVYVALGLVAAIENVVPPVPSDAAVLLGAFLSHRGVTTPLGVFAVVWTANLAGALAVYLAARRYGRQLFASPAGRRLLAPEAISVIEREYLRFGLAGIFLARFLPGIRAVVPPFAGIANLPALRVGLPIALAGAIWYGGVTLLGAVLGAEWDRIRDILAGVNRTLGLLALAVVVTWVTVAYLRARRRRRERVWQALTGALGVAGAPAEAERPVDPRAAAMLVLELAYADEALTPSDRALVEDHLRSRWGLAPAPRAEHAPPELGSAGRVTGYRERLVRRFGQPRRLALVERMWEAAFSDGAIGAHEARLMQRAGELLGLTPAEVAAARVRSRAALPAGANG